MEIIMKNNKSDEIVSECVKAISGIADRNNINIVDEDFIKDMALSAKFLNAAFTRQLGQPTVLHEHMSRIMNSV